MRHIKRSDVAIEMDGLNDLLHPRCEDEGLIRMFFPRLWCWVVQWCCIHTDLYHRNDVLVKRIDSSGDCCLMKVLSGKRQVRGEETGYTTRCLL